MGRVSFEVVGQLIGAGICFIAAGLAHFGLILHTGFAPHALACGLIALGIGIYVASYEWAERITDLLSGSVFVVHSMPVEISNLLIRGSAR